MAQRRDQPTAPTSAQTWQIRLPDGSVKQMPGAPSEVAPAAACCFCGRDLGDDEAGRVLLSARWMQEGEEEREQAWPAHRACLAERLHANVAGAGLFFG